ncbi:MAG: hypothetical protein VXW28_08135 [Candidatus Thermoplasmatota archaeon]|nr:hypothetical protein [Candidatus Thermoplasmatota archaeon]
MIRSIEEYTPKTGIIEVTRERYDDDDDDNDDDDNDEKEKEN